MEANEIKRLCNETVDRDFHGLWEVAQYLFDHPEVGFTEVKACEALCGDLQAHGFQVEREIGNLPTAFKARYQNGEGPRIAVFAEYDALDEIGHACGHHLIATSALGSAYAVKEAMQQADIHGTIEVYGTPAEENGGGKIIMLDHGAFDGVDAVFLMHPTSAKTRIGGECASFTDLKITYHGLSAHAESHPENGINAMDAATLFYQAIGLMRQQLKDNIHICCIISETNTDIGRISDLIKLEVEISTMSAADIKDVQKKIKNIAEGMALATGCSVEVEEIPGYLGRTPNTILGDIVREELIQLKEPVMDGMPQDCGGEDLGNVSRVIPAVNLFSTILPERKISGHTVEFRETSITDSGKHCLNISAKAMANAMVELFIHPEKLNAAKEELKERLQQEDSNYGK